MKHTILIVDDEQSILDSLSEILVETGAKVVTARSVAEAREKACGDLDLAIVDIMLRNDSGLDVLEFIKKEKPHVPVIMISGHGTISLTATAFKLGARDFLEKPLRLISVRASVRNALEALNLQQRVAEAQRSRHPRAVFTSAIMHDLYAQIGRLAGRREPVVIIGPSGTGKELVARSLHFDGPRANGPFIATNAASLPVNLAEDDLFGHEKGAFTGASDRRMGAIEQADGGTLFLDEIAEMDPLVQAKLLRVLENGEIMRLGGAKPLRVDVRIVAATHKDLEGLSRENAFRHDLWFRLCAFVLKVPALSERRGDIPLLAQAFLDRISDEMGAAYSFTPAALRLLAQRDYPGNIRELKHVVTRASVFSGKTVIDEQVIAGVFSKDHPATDKQNWPQTATGPLPYAGMNFSEAHDAFERDYFTEVLARHKGNITATAAAIGMAQSNLSRKLKQLNLK
jgi:two-component system, NtrC family, nitrogen regulation response regulator NtrX